MSSEILAYQIDDPTSDFKFSDRLARENMWTKEYTLRVIEEYKRFMYLCDVSGSSMTPSIQVDECWHLHMIYTRDYWDNFMKLFKKPIHHGPTKGGEEEDEKYVTQYVNTVVSYFIEFCYFPPDDIWPPAEIRFSPDNRFRIDFNDHWVIPVGDWKQLVKLLLNILKKKLCYFG